MREGLRGNTSGGNKTESLQEENLPLRGSPTSVRKPPRGTLVMKAKSKKERLGALWRSSRRRSRRKIFLSATFGPVAPLSVL